LANEVRTKADDALIPQGATGVALAAFDAAYVNNGKSGEKVKGPAFTLSHLSVVLPCSSSTPGTFLAFADTDLFNLGSSTSPAAMVFVPQGGGYKLAAFVQQGKLPGIWPTICTNKESTPDASINPSQVPTELAAALARDSVARPSDASAVAPFALNGYTDIYTCQQQDAKDSAAGESEAPTTFSPSSYPSYFFPLAGGRGFWVITSLVQQNTTLIPAGITSPTWPDGSQITNPNAPHTFHRATYYLSPIYSVVDPISSAGAPRVDGFAGFLNSATAS
jgi:hypothetical protein